MSNPSLYGQKPAKQSSTTAPSSSTLAFTSTLSSLISKDKESLSRTGRPRPSKSSKSDIFARPNKGAQKRAAADLRDDENTAFQQVHQSSAEIGSVDAATLHRSKRRMEEKVRIYEDLKKGAYLAEGSSDSEDDRNENRDAYLSRLRRKEKEGLVDFDKKWADAQRAKKSSNSDTDSSFEHTDDDNASIISYEDELGRTRRGTRKDAARAAKLKSQSEGGGEKENERWRPSRPENLIYGATVQSEAFQPSDIVASQMAQLAKRRDRSPTPDEVHYDADAEVRNRGTGFYAFSKDEEVRKKQMEELMNVRAETEDERRKEVDKLRAKRRAEMFLSGLGDIGVSG
ncbi:hypothetical protein BJX63DRAFT_183608 [Aspergillus granulosus]|uniref:Uncharacterized protein n=1 Tax=Aspergillus granulosus TaxID=176169 RepID=A0ABR4HIE1_9EURO